MMQTRMEATLRVMLAAALVVSNQAATSAANGEPDVIRATAPRVEADVRQSKIEVDVAALIEAVDRRVAEDLKKDLEVIGAPRIELAISEAPSRG